MSQAVAPGRPPRTVLASVPAPSATSPAGTSIPVMLVRLRALTAALCALVAALSAVLLVLGWQANRSAADDTEQLIRAQGIEVNLLRADALATNAFLVGGLEAPGRRAAYDGALEAAARSIADAAGAQPADRQVLAELNADVLRYAATMEIARANNRQGLPVGAAYLQSASRDLRGSALPLVEALVTANADRSTSAMGSQHPWLILVAAILDLLVLGSVNQWVARRFRRRVNVGLAGAAMAVTLFAVAGVATAALVADRNGSVQRTSYAVAVDGAAARTAANDAKSGESLLLIARGSGQAFEDAWKSASAVVLQRIRAMPSSSTELSAAWGLYVTDHQRIVSLDAGGQWDKAVAAATEIGAGSATAHFTAFDTALGELVRTSGQDAEAALRGGNWVFLAVATLTVLLGAVAAAAAWRGLSTRLEEYS